MSVHELASAFQWLYATLSGDATLAGYAPGGIFADLADEGTATPYVVFNVQSPGVDTLTANAVRIFAKPLYQVVAVGEAEKMTNIANAASQIDALLKRTSGTVTGGLMAVCYREQPLEKAELINTIKWKSLGGLYRILVEQTT